MIVRFVIGIMIVFSLFARAEAQQGEDDDNQDYFVEASVSNPTPYVGEQITYTMRYYAYTLDALFETDAPLRIPEFEGFWLNTVRDNPFRVEVVNNVQYNIGERTAEITPLTPGSFVIPASTLFIENQLFLPGGVFRSNPVALDVQPLPPDAPKGFNGAVGQYSVSTEIDRFSVDLGEPITLKMDIQGVGNLDLLPAPELNLGDNWQIVTTPARPPVYSSDINFGQRVFEWLLIPRATGTLTLDTIQFVYFDPEQGIYLTQPAPSFTVNVFPGDTALDAMPQFAPSSSVLELKPIETLDPQRGRQSSFTTTFWMIWFIGPISVLGVIGIKIYSTYVAKRKKNQRFKSALKNALARLSKIKRQRQEITTIKQIIYQYAADKHDTSIAEVRSEFKHMAALQDIINRIDHIAYVPADLSVDIDGLVKQIKAILRDIDREWAS